MGAARPGVILPEEETAVTIVIPADLPRHLLGSLPRFWIGRSLLDPVNWQNSIDHNFATSLPELELPQHLHRELS